MFQQLFFFLNFFKLSFLHKTTVKSTKEACWVCTYVKVGGRVGFFFFIFFLYISFWIINFFSHFFFLNFFSLFKYKKLYSIKLCWVSWCDSSGKNIKDSQWESQHIQTQLQIKLCRTAQKGKRFIHCGVNSLEITEAWWFNHNADRSRWVERFWFMPKPFELLK